MAKQTTVRFKRPAVVATPITDGSGLPSAAPVSGGNVIERVGDPSEYVSWERWASQVRGLGSPYSLNWYIELTKRGRIPVIPDGSALAARFRGTLGPEFLTALETGANLAGAAQQLPINNPIAAIATTAAAFVGGLAFGLFPFERIDAENKWRSFCGQLSPLERMATLVSLEPSIRRAFSEDNIALPAGESFEWRYTDDVVHTLWGNKVSTINGLVEILFASGRIYDGDDFRVRLWVMTYAHGFANGSTRVGQWYAIPHSGTMAAVRDSVAVNDGRALFADWEGKTVADLRIACQSYGITSLFNPQTTKALRDSADIRFYG